MMSSEPSSQQIQPQLPVDQAGVPGVPPPPGNPSTIPDADTEKGFDFAAGDHAENRILHIKTRWFRYGTDDKGHAAALVLSGLLLVSAPIIAIIGCVSLFSGKDPQWFQTLVTWIGNAFLFTAGIAVGKSAKSDK
jgi:hypothetical protein